MLDKKLHYCLLGLWLASSLGILLWGVWPGSPESHELSVPGFGSINMEWKPDNRIGDIAILGLSLAMQGKTGQPDGPQILNNATITDVHGIQDVNINDRDIDLVEARLELPGTDVQPHDIVSQPIHPGGEAAFYWNVQSRKEGDFQGRLWLYLRNHTFGSDAEHRYPIAIQKVDLHWRNLFGLSGVAARFTGLFGLISGITFAMLIWLRTRGMPSMSADGVYTKDSSK